MGGGRAPPNSASVVGLEGEVPEAVHALAGGESHAIFILELGEKAAEHHSPAADGKSMPLGGPFDVGGQAMGLVGRKGGLEEGGQAPII